MRVIIDLDENVLKKLQAKADNEKRSRKNYMETVLESIANDSNPTSERTIKQQEPEKPKDKKQEVSDFWKQRMKNKLGI